VFSSYREVDASCSDVAIEAMIQQETENHGVGGSIPPLGTIFFNDLAEFRRFTDLTNHQ